MEPDRCVIVVTGSDAWLVIAAKNQKSRRAVVVQKFLLCDLPLLLFDYTVLLLFLFLAAAVVGRRRRVIAAHCGR